MIYYVFLAILFFFVFKKLIPVSGVKQITTEQLKQIVKEKNIQFIDVRTPGEFKTRKINGFKNIPLNILSKKLSELSREKEIVVICQSGMRSSRACKILKKAGFKKVTNVKGGMNAY